MKCRFLFGAVGGGQWRQEAPLILAEQGFGLGFLNRILIKYHNKKFIKYFFLFSSFLKKVIIQLFVMQIDFM